MDDTAGIAGLIQRLARQPDTASWAELDRRCRDQIRRICLRAIGDADLAEDAVQETLLLVRRAACRFTPVQGSGRDRAALGWIQSLARRTAVRLAQRRQARREGSLLDGDAHVSEVADDLITAESRAIVDRELSGLEDRIRHPLRLRFFDGLDHADVATALRTSPGNARVLVHRGLKRLRDRLLKVGYIASAVPLMECLRRSFAPPAVLAVVPKTSLVIGASVALGLIAVGTGLTGLTSDAAVPFVAGDQRPTQHPGVEAPAKTAPPALPALLPERLPLMAFIPPDTTVPPVAKPTVPDRVEVAPVMPRPLPRVLSQFPKPAIAAPATVAAVNPPPGGGKANEGDGDDDGNRIRVTPVPLGGRPMLAVEAPAEDSHPQIRQHLQARMTLRFQDTPIAEVADFFRKNCKVNVVVEPALIASGITVTLEVTDMTADVALDWVVRLARIHRCIINEAVYLSLKPPKRARTLTLIDAGDLVTPVRDFPGPTLSMPQPGGGGGMDLFAPAPGAAEKAQEPMEIQQLAEFLERSLNGRRK